MRKPAIFLLILATSFSHSCSENPVPTQQQQVLQGEFTLLTYNVAGLPQEISPSNPELNIPLISPLLNKYDIALVQEDFFYHNQLSAEALHPHKSIPKADSIQFTAGDGLNRFSNFSFSNFSRQRWSDCSNQSGNDCFAQKGYSVAETELASGVKVDIYNMHLDAGGTTEDLNARKRQVQQVVAAINSRSNGKAVIIAGDLNLNLANRPQDQPIFQSLLDGAGLTDVCHFLSCGDEHVDRILFRASQNLDLQPTVWKVDSDFVDESGNKLSDHFAIGATFVWQTR